MTALEALIDRAIRAEFRTAGALAAAIGMTDSGFSRGVARGSLSVANLLALARVTHHSGPEVLRAAGKDDVADLLEALYPKTGSPGLTADEQGLVETYRRCPAQVRALMRQAGEVFLHVRRPR